MTEATHRHLFGLVMFWTILTTIFVWLPLVRIIARPEGYTWGILGLSGEGYDGPFWIFIPLTLYAVTLLYTAQRGPRALAHPMLILWHLTVTAVFTAAVFQGGADATVQGQGLRWTVPLWVLLVPTVLFTAAAIVWAVLDRRRPVSPHPAWTRTNTARLIVSLLLLGLALVLFRLGTNYNWVTAAAIIATIIHWIYLARSFEPSG